MLHRKDFEMYLNSCLEGLDVTEKVKILERIQSEWLPNMILDIAKNHVFCEKCAKYSKAEDCVKLFKREVKTEPVDKGRSIADIEYEVTYVKCPLCGRYHETGRRRIKEVNFRLND